MPTHSNPGLRDITELPCRFQGFENMSAIGQVHSEAGFRNHLLSAYKRDIHAVPALQGGNL